MGNRHFCLPVKGNAYDHGLCEIGKIAQEADVNSLGVSCLQEAAKLREFGITLPIILFGAIHEDQIDDLIRLDCELSISSQYKAELIAQKGKRVKVHIEIDTGMRRTGVRAQNALKLVSFVQNFNCFEIVGIYSHFATADTPNHPFALEQIEAFRKIAKELKGIRCHLANSGGVAFYPDSYFDMVRPGILCYGYYPNAIEGKIKPCFTLKSKVSYFKVVPENSGISYGHHYRTQKQSRIATIPIGYGDGFRRNFSNALVMIRNKTYPIAGTICMDQFMIDLADGEAFAGDEVLIIGNELPLWSLARSINTIPHEILSGFNDRVPRIYIY